MSIAVRQAAFVMSDPTPGNVSFGSNVLAGSVIAVYAMVANASVPAITDSQGNTYTAAIQQVNGSWYMNVWTAVTGSAGALTVTATLSGATFDCLHVWEVTEADTGDPVDVTVGRSEGSGTSPWSTGNTAAMSQNNGLVLGVFTNATAQMSAGSGFTQRVSNAGSAWHCVEDRVVTSGGVQSADVTFSGTSSTQGGACVVLKEAAGGATYGDVRSHTRGMKRGLRLRLTRRAA